MSRWRFPLLALALAAGLASYARAGEDDYRHHYADERYRDSREGYQEGFSQGQHDASRGRRYDYRAGHWKHADHSYREAYQRGYEDGYNRAGGNYRGGYSYGNRYPDEAYGSRAGGYYGGDPSRIGYQDGMLDGERDVRTGHSFRPTHQDNYKHADRGYHHGMGKKDYYKQSYRSGYMQGYQRGYGRR